MKKTIVLFLFMVAAYLGAQESHYNTSKGYAVKGYDVTEYFENKAVKGDSQYTATYKGIAYRFANEKNLTNFKNDPEKFIPQYGGYCAYAIGKDSKKVDIDPETYEVRDGKLYLFYNSWGVNTLKKWKKEGASDLKEKADKNWEKIVGAH